MFILSAAKRRKHSKDPDGSIHNEAPVDLCQRQEGSLSAPVPYTTVVVICNALVDENLVTCPCKPCGNAQSCILTLTQLDFASPDSLTLKEEAAQ